MWNFMCNICLTFMWLNSSAKSFVECFILYSLRAMNRDNLPWCAKCGEICKPHEFKWYSHEKSMRASAVHVNGFFGGTLPSWKNTLTFTDGTVTSLPLLSMSFRSKLLATNWGWSCEFCSFAFMFAHRQHDGHCIFCGFIRDCNVGIDHLL